MDKDNDLADTRDVDCMSVKNHLTGEVQGRLSCGSCSKVLPTWSTQSTLLGADVMYNCNRNSA